MDFERKIRVNKSVSPIPVMERKPFPLVLGNTYYVSFRSNIAAPCILIDISGEQQIKQVTIEISIKQKVNKGCADAFTAADRKWAIQKKLQSNEIGTSPEEAVRHKASE